MNLNPSRPVPDSIETDNLKSLFGFQGVTTFTNERLVVVVVVVIPGDIDYVLVTRDQASITVWPHR